MPQEIEAVIRHYVVKEYLEEGDDRTIEAETPLLLLLSCMDANAGVFGPSWGRRTW